MPRPRNEAIEDLGIPLPPRIPLSQADRQRVEEEKTKDIEKYKLRFKPPSMCFRLTHPVFVDQKIEVAKQLDMSVKRAREARIRANSGLRIREFMARELNVSPLLVQTQSLKEEEPTVSRSGSRGSSRSSSRGSSRHYNRFPREYRDNKGNLKLRGTRSKELHFRLTLPFSVRQQEPWWFDPSDGMEEGDDGSGILMDAQTASGARISVLEDSAGILVIKSPKLESALHCCCLIMNAAMEHHACEVVPCRVSVSSMVDGRMHISPPPPETGLDDEWPQEQFCVCGNFFSTVSATSPVLFAPAPTHTHPPHCVLDFKAYRYEVPTGKLPAREIKHIEMNYKSKIHNEEEGRVLCASMWRIPDCALGRGGVILAGKSGDVEGLYYSLQDHLTRIEQSLAAQNRTYIPALPNQPGLLSKAAPVSRIPPNRSRSPMFSFLHKPFKSEAQIIAEKKKVLAIAAERSVNLVSTADIVAKEKEMHRQYERVKQAAAMAEQEAEEAKEAELNAKRERKEADDAERDAVAAETELKLVMQLGDEDRLHEVRQKAIVMRKKAIKELAEAEEAIITAKREREEADEAVRKSNEEMKKVQKIVEEYNEKMKHR